MINIKKAYMFDFTQFSERKILNVAENDSMEIIENNLSNIIVYELQDLFTEIPSYNDKYLFELYRHKFKNFNLEMVTIFSYIKEELQRDIIDIDLEYFHYLTNLFIKKEYNIPFYNYLIKFINDADNVIFKIINKEINVIDYNLEFFYNICDNLFGTCFSNSNDYDYFKSYIDTQIDENEKYFVYLSLLQLIWFTCPKLVADSVEYNSIELEGGTFHSKFNIYKDYLFNIKKRFKNTELYNLEIIWDQLDSEKQFSYYLKLL